jgi:hypothetical protein
MPPPELDKIQRWMQAAIVDSAEPSPALTRRTVRPSHSMSPEQRVGVYREMYVARLNEALRSDYPALAALLGDSLFDELAELYVREQPSRSYSLNDLGAGLPGFLHRLDGLPNPAYACDLARFELAKAQVFDEVETAPISPEAIPPIRPSDWEAVRLKPIAAFRLLSLRYPVQEYAGWVKQEKSGPKPAMRRRNTRLVVYRRNYSVASMVLDREAFTVLSHLAEGLPLGRALEASSPAPGVFEMFRRWMSEGLFQSIDPERPADSLGS